MNAFDSLALIGTRKMNFVLLCTRLFHDVPCSDSLRERHQEKKSLFGTSIAAKNSGCQSSQSIDPPFRIGYHHLQQAGWLSHGQLEGKFDSRVGCMHFLGGVVPC